MIETEQQGNGFRILAAAFSAGVLQPQKPPTGMPAWSRRLPLSEYQAWRCGFANRRRHLAEYREEIAKNGEMMVDNVAELIDLDYACHEALAIHSARQAQQQAA